MYGSEGMTIRQTLTLKTVTVSMKISLYKAIATNHDHTDVIVFMRGKLVSLKIQHAVSRNQTWNCYNTNMHTYILCKHTDTHTHTHTHTHLSLIHI